tara:strand:- start:551 stop:1420 length:870 start_codon:yes stop_codon:yes gene_type:complete
MKKKITKAIFPMGGLGTRFLPATKVIAKEMLTILDRPVIEWAVREASDAGIKEMIFVISSKKKSIIKHFERSKILEYMLKKNKKLSKLDLITAQSKLGKFSFVIQNEAKGLGHAVWCARKFVDENENFAVILPDDIIHSKIPSIKQLVDVSERTLGGSVVALEKVPMKDVSKYGVVEVSKKKSNYFFLKNIVEKPKQLEAPSNLSVVGRYILNSKIFDYLKFQKKGYGNEIQLTDALNFLVEKPGLYGIEFEGRRFDCGGKLGFLEANLFFGLNDKDINKNIRKIVKRI